MHTKEPMAVNIFSKILLIFGFSMFAYIVYISYQSTTSLYASKLWLVANIIFMMLIVSIGALIINKYFNVKMFLLFLLIGGFGIRLWWILTIKTVPDSDFALMYEAAKQAAKGDFSFSSYGYFQRWVYQLGFTLYEAVIIKLFGNHLVVLKLINILFSLGTSLIIYLLGKKGINEGSGRIAALLYTFYIPNILYCSVLTNQHISTFLFFAGLYLLLVRGISEKLNWIWVGLLLGIGNIIRPAGSFFLIGLVVFVVVYQLFPLKKKLSFKYIIRLIGVFLVYLMIQQLVSFTIVHTGISNKPLSNQDPYWKFVVGLNYHSDGEWNNADDQYVSQFKLGPERSKAELLLIKERTKNKSKLMELFHNKFDIFWGGGDPSVVWSLGTENRPDLKQSLMKFERLMYITFCLFGIGIVTLFKKNNRLVPLCLILIGGYAAIHLMVEMQTRYRFDILPAFFLLTGYGVHIINQFVFEKIFRGSNKSLPSLFNFNSGRGKV